MFDVTDELMKYMEKFEEYFGDIVPLLEIPQSVTTEEIIEAIKDSFEAKKDLLPERFGYEELENDEDILM